MRGDLLYNTDMPRTEDIVESALEFLQTSCDEYERVDLEEQRRLKHSTISLCTGIELVLKARLSQEHWTLVPANIDRYQEGDWERGSFQSVGLRDAIARLSEVCHVDISQQAETAFSDLSDVRNKFTHFVSEESAERVTGTQLRAWHYFVDLVDDDFLRLTEKQSSALQAIKNRMLQREEFLTVRFEHIRSMIEARIEAGGDVIVCPFCNHTALSVGEGAVCLVCGSGKSEPGKYAEEYARRSAHWMSSDEYYNMQWAAECSECRERACTVAPSELRGKCEEAVLENEGIRRESGVEIEPWYCFNCGAVYDSIDVVECTRCGKLFARTGEESLCPSCSW